MGKQRKGGLPYLKSSLKINWNSGQGVPVEEQKSLISDVLSYLEEKGDQDEQSEPPDRSVLNVVTANAGYGLQACIDLSKTETAPIVFLDSICPRPSAVSNALGLYFSNYADSVKVYCLQGIEELLWDKLNRKTNAFVVKHCPQQLRERLEEVLTPMHIQTGRQGSSLTPISLVKSMGKPEKVKKKK
ncbi:unnamed protein product [Haemonchus placei]|uniref:Ribosomal_L7Ae domain-containing protein n=1 Tax=Haemonchus placei TaxID=6290 RepID=A0A0N4X4P3_HAEPC|nr:unnamed protein product [Haemonchus placei]